MAYRRRVQWIAVAALLGLGACGPRSTGATGGAGAPVPPDGSCFTPSGVTTLFQDYAYAISLEGGSAYLATQSGLLRMPVAGGSPTPLATGAEVDALALDGTNAYYFSSHPAGPPNAQGKVSTTTALYSVPLAGGAPQILVDGSFAMHLATDGTWLWWTGVGLNGTPLGQPRAPLKFPLEDAAIVEAIAVGKEALFLAVYAVGNPGVGTIRRVNKDGTGLTTIVSGLQHPTAIALDEDAVYFNDAGSAPGGIGRAGLDGSGETLLVQVLTDSLVVDGHSVYFATADAIQKVPKTGGKPQTVVNGLKSPGTLAIAGGNVYWVDGTSVALSDPNPGYAVMTSCK